MDASADTTMLPAASAPAESAPPEAVMTTNRDFAEHINRVRAHRAELRESVAADCECKRRQQSSKPAFASHHNGGCVVSFGGNPKPAADSVNGLSENRSKG